MKVLLDSNAYTALCRGDERVAERIRDAETVYLSMVVIGELLAGFRHGTREAENRERLSEFLADPAFEELPVSRETTEHFAAIWSELRAKGCPIPTNDIWIASHARQTGGELITFDRHFREVSGLLLQWFETRRTRHSTDSVD